MGENKNGPTLRPETEGGETLKERKRIRENDIKMEFQEKRWEDAYWINLVPPRVQCGILWIR
jgi:hypothetical protein